MAEEGPIVDSYRTLAQKPYRSDYFYVETVIDQRIERVWQQALRIGDWMTDHRLETIAGKAGEIGHFERVYSCGITPEVPKPHYHLYGIAEIIPLKCIALEVFPERGGSYGDAKQWTAFDSILFSDLDGRTRVAFLQVHVSTEGNTDRADDAHADERREQQEATGRERLHRYFENLKRLVSDY
jgi:hypothetical protein